MGGILFSLLFTLLIWAIGGRLNAIELLPDAGPSWYLWKLPEATVWTRISAWAIIYTFWFHPMVGEWQHLIGFLYMFLLMLQGSLFLTRIHVNKWWMGVQEVTVLFHGTLVAILHKQAWPMFFFGFFGLFVVTQMYGLGLKKWQRWVFLGIYVGSMIVIYSLRDWATAYEVVFIPLAEYALVFIMAGLIWLLMKGVAYWQFK